MLPEKKMSFLDIGLASLEELAEPWNDLTEGEEKMKESCLLGWRRVVVRFLERRLSDILLSLLTLLACTSSLSSAVENFWSFKWKFLSLWFSLKSSSSASAIFSMVATDLIMGIALKLWLGEIPILGIFVPSGSSIVSKTLLFLLTWGTITSSKEPSDWDPQSVYRSDLSL